MKSELNVSLGENWRDELVRLLGRQHEVCDELMARCRRQSDLLTAGQSDALLELLQERQQLIDELGDLSASLEPYRQAWPEVWTLLDGRERSRVQTLVRNIQELVNVVRERDVSDHETLQRERARLRKEMDSVNTGRQSQKAYGRSVHRGVERVTNRFTDSKG